MDNAQKAIMIGVGLFITIALISAVMLITGIGTDMMGNSNKQLEGVSASVSSQLISDYDDHEMTGASVIASIKKFADKENFLLKVEGINDINLSTLTAADDDEFNYNVDAKCYYYSGTVNKTEATVTGLSDKIKSTAKYKSYLIYQKDTDKILGVYFIKV